jgi:hypothetical protein
MRLGVPGVPQIRGLGQQALLISMVLGGQTHAVPSVQTVPSGQQITAGPVLQTWAAGQQ